MRVKPERREVYRVVDPRGDAFIVQDDGSIVVVHTTATVSPDCTIRIGRGEAPTWPCVHPATSVATSAAARARKTLRGLLGPWRYLRFLHQGHVRTRWPSGRVWQLNMNGLHYLWCQNGHKMGVCQSETGLRESVPGEDKIAFALLYLRNGPDGERELIAKGGVTAEPMCADCAEALGKEWPRTTDPIYNNMNWAPLRMEPMDEARREILDRAVREQMHANAMSIERQIEGLLLASRDRQDQRLAAASARSWVAQGEQDLAVSSMWRRLGERLLGST